ncbi:MAG: hypothetical protein ABIM89_13065 [Mycobacteriales bacterium]
MTANLDIFVTGSGVVRIARGNGTSSFTPLVPLTAAAFPAGQYVPLVPR